MGTALPASKSQKLTKIRNNPFQDTGHQAAKDGLLSEGVSLLLPLLIA